MSVPPSYAPFQAALTSKYVIERELVRGVMATVYLPLYDSGEAGGTLYFVMPLMQGQTLRERLDRL